MARRGRAECDAAAGIPPVASGALDRLVDGARRCADGDGDIHRDRDRQVRANRFVPTLLGRSIAGRRRSVRCMPRWLPSGIALVVLAGLVACSRTAPRPESEPAASSAPAVPSSSVQTLKLTYNKPTVGARVRVAPG